VASAYVCPIYEWYFDHQRREKYLGNRIIFIQLHAWMVL